MNTVMEHVQKILRVPLSGTKDICVVALSLQIYIFSVFNTILSY